MVVIWGKLFQVWGINFHVQFSPGQVIIAKEGLLNRVQMAVGKGMLQQCWQKMFNQVESVPGTRCW